jgi:hypothetical protein
MSADFDNSRSDLEFTYNIRNYEAVTGSGAFINIVRASVYNNLFTAVRVIGTGPLAEPYAIDVLIGNYVGLGNPGVITCLYETQFQGAILNTPTFVSASATGSFTVKTVYTTNSLGWPSLGPVYSDSLAVATTQGQLTVGYRGNYAYDTPAGLNYALLVSGSVGIGTTSPAYKLDITGDARIASAAGTGALYFGTLDPSYIYLKLDNNYDLTLAQDASSNNGLYLAGAGNVYVSIDSNNNGTTNAFIVQNNAIKAGTELFRVNESGNVGIGSSSPAYKLDVNGAINTNTFMYVTYPYGNALPLQLTANNFLKADNYYYGMLIKSGDVNYISGRFLINGGSDKRVELYGYEESIGYIPVVIPGGNVGIGTTSPTNGTLQVYNASGNTLSLQKSGGYAALMMGSENNNYALIESLVNGGIRFYTGDGTLTEKMRIISTGEVGIGTTAAFSTGGTAQLSVTTNVNAVALSFGASNTDMSYIRRLSAGVFQWQTYNGANDGQIHLQPYGGNVGIGTTSPVAKLDIRGGIQLLNSSGSTSAATSASLMILGQNTVGGSSYHDFLYTRNTLSTATNPQKTFRLTQVGTLEIINDAYTVVILSLTNAGVLSTPGGGTSDIRTKQNVEYIYEDASTTINKLKPVKFEFKDYPNVKRHGFIAQDVLPIKPELVLGDGDKPDGTYGLDYDGILALTVKALQEANIKTKQLENKIETLEARLSVLENK